MSFFNELKRRNVIKVAIAYTVLGWLSAQVAEFATENFGAPEWALKTFVVFLILGLPFALIFAWAFEMTPDGIKRERDVDRTQSITNKTGRKLDFTIIAVLLLVAAYFVWESRFQNDTTISATGDAQTSTPVIPANAGIHLKPTNDEPITSNENSIAVLPFANRSRDEDDAFFSDGIHDDLLTQLAKISDLRVISRTSVMKYKDTEKTIPEIASELGVSTILEGGIQRAGKRIRINAQLIDVNTDQHLWAETFDREMTVENIFDIQSEITRQIVSAVQLELTETELLLLAQAPTDNLQAYEAYLRARELVNLADYSQENFIAAQPWAELAVQLDPKFASAWAILTDIHGMAIWIGYDVSPERHQAARQALDMALRYGPNLPSTLAAQGDYSYRLENNYSTSLKAFELAHQALPGDASLLEKMATAQRRLGLWEQAINSLEKAIQLDPANSSAPNLLVSTLIMMRQWQRVIPLIEKWTLKFPEVGDLQAARVLARIYYYGDLTGARTLLDNMQPRVSEAYVDLVTNLPLLERDYQAEIAVWNLPEAKALSGNSGWLGWHELSLGIAYQALGDTELARQQWLGAVEIITAANTTLTTGGAYDYGTLATTYALLGKNEDALEIMRKTVAFMPEEKDRITGTYMATLNAFVLARTGNRDRALTEIERLLNQPAGFRRWNLYLNPQWDFFRDDERFNELIRPLNLKEAGQ